MDRLERSSAKRAYMVRAMVYTFRQTYIYIHTYISGIHEPDIWIFFCIYINIYTRVKGGVLMSRLEWSPAARAHVVRCIVYTTIVYIWLPYWDTLFFLRVAIQWHIHKHVNLHTHARAQARTRTHALVYAYISMCIYAYIQYGSESCWTVSSAFPRRVQIWYAIVYVQLKYWALHTRIYVIIDTFTFTDTCRHTHTLRRAYIYTHIYIYIRAYI